MAAEATDPSSADTATLGIIAGKGRLPAQLAASAQAAGRPVFILALKGHADADDIGALPHDWIRLGDGAKALRLLRAAGVRDLVFAGGVTRPSLWSLRPDARAAAFLAKVGFHAMGDDSLLSAIVKEFEAEGFRVVGTDAIWQESRMPAGQLGNAAPDDAAWRDIRRGINVAEALGEADVGQSIVVQQGIILAVEAVEGTDAMLARAADLKRDGVGAVLVKISKPGQNERVDLPTIGPDTIRAAQAAGLRGIAVQAHSAILLDRDETVRAADSAGLFVYGIDLNRV